MSKNYERFKEKDSRSHYDKPKKQRRPQHHDDDEANAYKLLKSGYSVEDLSSIDFDN